MADEERPEIPPEDLLEAIRKMKVSDLLLSTVSTTVQLGYAKLEPDSRDLEQARLAIESTKVLLPLLAGAVDKEVLGEFDQLVANLQLAYAKAAAAEQQESDPTS